MLFAVKNRLLPTLGLLVLLATGSYSAAELCHLEWHLDIRSTFWRDIMLAALVIAASDAVLHVLLGWLGGKSYLKCYRALAEYFRPQGKPEIIAGSLLAGGEELIFRGVLLQTLIVKVGVVPASAFVLTALLFGLLHLIPRRDLLPFAGWAVWEGALLNAIYLASGSLLVSMVVHILHDLAGFSLFATQRRTGWRLGGTHGNRP